jgi:hypothetical protein
LFQQMVTRKENCLFIIYMISALVGLVSKCGKTHIYQYFY